jgi:arsenical pump membrane protein
MPYLIAEFVAANTWSMALIIGNPTNIYLASSSGIDFINYLKVMLFPTLFAGLVSFGLLYLIFKKQLSKTIDINVDNERLRDKKLVVLGLVHLALCTVVLTISSYIDLPMWIISAGFALSLFVCVLLVYLKRRKKPNVLYRTIVRLPFELVPFVISMFTIVLSLDYVGATKLIADFLNDFGSVFSFGFISVAIANIINNIPMSVLFSSVLSNVSLTDNEYLKAVFACVAGSNIGAYLTPVGALAGIMWSSILKLYGIKLSFKDFIKNGIVIAIPTLLAALVGIEIVL